MRRGPRTGRSTAREHSVELELPEAVATVVVAADEAILFAARRAGIELPSLCERGWCTRCAARLLAGEIEHAGAARYFEADRAAGFALTCTAFARTPLRLRTHAEADLREHRRRCGLPAPGG